MSADSDPDAALDRLAEEFVDRTRGGEHPSISEYVRLHPEHEQDIREIFPLLSAMETAKSEKPLAGTRVGPYEIVREIGRGGMGVVYEALQTDLGRRVALKILPVRATLDASFLERFRLEAQAAAKLRHTSIVPVIGYGTDGDLHYYSMQFIEGRGLDQVVTELVEKEEQGSTTRGRDDYRRIARIGLQLAQAMAHAHAQGILHRDLKPTNVLLDADEHAWITDFGLCYQTDSEGLTRTGDVVGTFRYMPPERFSGFSDARGDIYGIGITLYELLTRKRAYEGDDAAVLAARIPKEEPRRPRSIDARIPSELDLIVRKAMAHDPEQRYATADALASDLRAFLDNQPIAARAPTAGYLLRKAVARHSTLTVTVLVALGLLVASSIWYVRDLQEKERRAREGQYAAGISGVAAALKSRDVHRAASLLEQAPAEHRNWEWHHLKSRLRSELRRFESLPYKVSGVAFSPDGRHFASACGRDVLIHEYASAKIVGRLSTEAETAQIAWSPDGGTLAVGTWTGLEVFDWPGGRRVFRSGPGIHRYVAFAAEGKEILAAVVEGWIKRLSAHDGTVLAEYRLPDRVLAMSCDDARNPQRIAVGTADGKVTVLRAGDGEVLWSARVSDHAVRHVLFSDESEVACVHEGKLFTWNAATGDLLQTRGFGGALGPFTRDPLNRRFLIHRGGEVLVVGRENGEILRALSGEATPQCGAVHPDGRHLIVGGRLGSLHAWYLGEERDPLVLGAHMDDVIALDVHPDGHRAASGGFGGILRIWDLDAGELATVRIAHESHSESVCYSPDGRWLASADYSGAIHLWDAESAEPVRRWQAAERGLIRLAFLPGRAGLLSYHGTGALRMWSLPDGKPLKSMPSLEAWDEENRGYPVLVASPDGRWIAHSLPDGRVLVRDGGTLQVARVLSAHEDVVTGLAFHPALPLLASVSNDNSLRLWDPATGESKGSHASRDLGRAPEGGLHRVAFSPDGSRLATGSFTGTVTLWSTQTVRPIVSLERDHWIAELHFTPDGTRLVTGLTYGIVSVFDTIPVRERVPAYETAILQRERARVALSAVLAETPDLDEARRALRESSDVEPTLRTAMLRLLDRHRGTQEGLVKRLWRDLTPPEGDPARQRVARALAWGLWRATHHQERPDPRCDTLLLLACLRCGDHEVTLQYFDMVAPLNRKRAPEMYAIDLAIASLTHRALEQVDEAQARLGQLEALLEAEPGLRTPRVRRFHAEAAER